MTTMQKYKKLTGGKMKVIVQVGLDEKNKDIYNILERIRSQGYIAGMVWVKPG